MAEKHYSIAIDGPSGAGKSTLAQAVARELGLVYVDTGAIYRSVGYYAYQKGVDPRDQQAVAALLPEIHIEITYGEDGLQHMLLNGTDVTREIRLPEISMYASHVSAIPAVRAFLLDMQREMARSHSVIMDGRDIGTVVLPDATVKIFLTASPEARAQRRFAELQAKGEQADFETVLADIRRRDDQDTHRATAPLRRADDAVLVDTSELDIEQSFALLKKTILDRIG